MTAIKRIRERLGLNQADFAELAGVTQATVSRWEDDMKPTLAKIDHLRNEAKKRGLPWQDSWVFEAAAE